MDFIRNHLPICPLEARKFHCPAIALNLDSEIAGVFWIYFCCRTIAQLFPGGLQIEVHVYIETENNGQEAGHEEEHAADDWEVDDDVGVVGDDAMLMALREQRALEDLT